MDKYIAADVARPPTFSRQLSSDTGEQMATVVISEPSCDLLVLDPTAPRGKPGCSATTGVGDVRVVEILSLGSSREEREQGDEAA